MFALVIFTQGWYSKQNNIGAPKVYAKLQIVIAMLDFSILLLAKVYILSFFLVPVLCFFSLLLSYIAAKTEVRTRNNYCYPKTVGRVIAQKKKRWTNVQIQWEKNMMQRD